MATGLTLLLSKTQQLHEHAVNNHLYLSEDFAGKEMVHNVKAFVFVAEFETRQLGTNADVKYKSSLLIQLLTL